LEEGLAEREVLYVLEDFAVYVGDVGRAAEVIGVVEVLVALEGCAAGVVVAITVSGRGASSP